MPVILADDGKGNVAPSITVVSDQKFWLKGYSDKPSSRIDAWFDEYGPYPPYPYVKSHWLCTVYSNQERYFHTYPYDLLWLHNTGRRNGKGNIIWELHESKRGKIWEGPIENNLGFKVTESGTASIYAKVFPSTAQPPGEEYELRIYFLKLPWANKVASETIFGSLASAISPLVERLGYKYRKITCNWDENYYSLWFLKTGSPAGIVAVVLGAAAIIGFILLGIGLILNGIAWLKQGGVEEQQTRDKQEFVDDLNTLLANGQITPEQYAQMLEAYEKAKEKIEGVPWGGLMTVAVIFGGIYLLSKMAPGKSEKSGRGEIV